MTTDNFARVESDRMLAAVLRDSTQVNAWTHNRVPTPLDHQPVIRQNRDTLYSGAVVDVSQGVTITLPDSGDRYLTAMVIDQDGYVDAVIHEPGEHHLAADQLVTPHVFLAVRILVDPNDATDVTAVNTLQDELVVRAGSARPFVLPDYDPESLAATRDSLLKLASGLPDMRRAFGRRGEVDPVRHLLGCAAAWGGLPDEEALYLNVNPGLPVGAYELTVGHVPVDGFWSISVYNADGYFDVDADGAVNINSVTAVPESDGTTVIRFGGPEEHPNRLSISDGWNYMIRLYQPHQEVLNGSWTFPAVRPVNSSTLDQDATAT
ncbi:DUF1254 domain-containing protein [Rhodococcus olei]|uniref:DUF1254 domain-containing protein n=1 Tax=Rhodococcus olei TaxID=2161675 RepID=A0ABP8PKH8_9NOCA